MRREDILANFSRTFHRTGFAIKKRSPEIMLVAGVVGVVASAVMACKATTKANEIVAETKGSIDVIHEGVEKGEIRGTEYTEEDGKKDLTIVYAQTGLEFAKLYGPAVALGTISIISILGSHNVMRRRNIALAAAYATVDQSFKDYRGRLIERFGEELDRELKYNLKSKEIEERVVDESGNETVTTRTVQTIDPTTYSEYSRFFMEGCIGWEKNAEMNLAFLLQQQSYANRKLKAQGYLFLNDVYEMLGIPKTAAGQVVGWVYDDKHPIGDNYVDFGIHDYENERAQAFVNGWERVILLDFNVDGNILQYI